MLQRGGRGVGCLFVQTQNITEYHLWKFMKTTKIERLASFSQDSKGVYQPFIVYRLLLSTFHKA